MIQIDDGVPASRGSALDGVKPDECIGPKLVNNWRSPGIAVGAGITAPHEGVQSMGKRVIELQIENDSFLKENNQLRKELSSLRNAIDDLEGDLAEAKEDLVRETEKHKKALEAINATFEQETRHTESLRADNAKLKQDLVTANMALRLITAVLENHQTLASE